jgi:predicted tellurium resistance membrane protein TerC
VRLHRHAQPVRDGPSCSRACSDLKLVGALLLLWIGIKLLLPEDEAAHAQIQASDKLWAAVKTVIVADLVMSVDNVIAIAGAAQGAGRRTRCRW